MLYNGIISKPGIISSIVNAPIQLKKITQKAIPEKSRISPKMGVDINGTNKSRRSRAKHTARVDKSSQVKKRDHWVSRV